MNISTVIADTQCILLNMCKSACVAIGSSGRGSEGKLGGSRLSQWSDM